MANEAITPKGPATGRGLATLATGVVRALFYAAVMLGGPGYFGHSGKPAEMATAVLAGALLLFFLNCTASVGSRGRAMKPSSSRR